MGIFSLLKLFGQGRFLFWAGVGILTSFGLALDLLYDSKLQKFSFLGYDPVAGARYYGIGNEYMGVMIGAALLGTVAILEVWNRRAKADGKTITEEAVPQKAGDLMIRLLFALICLYYVVVVFLMASPDHGANVGGSLAISAAVGVALGGIARYTGVLSFKGIQGFAPVLTVCFFLLLVGMVWAWNFTFNQSGHWHLQAFWDQWRTQGLEGVEGLLQRKAAMNVRLIRYSIWTRALVAFLGLLAVLFFYPAGIMKRFFKEVRFMFIGVIAMITGSVAALVINDSGVVAAATTLLFGVHPLLAYFLDEFTGSAA